MLRNTSSSGSPISHADTSSNPALIPSPPPLLPARLLLPSSSPFSSVCAADFHLHLPPPDTAVWAFLWLSDCLHFRTGDLHHKLQSIRVGATHDHHTTVTPGPVLGSIGQQLAQAFQSRAFVLLSLGDVRYALTGVLSAMVSSAPHRRSRSAASALPCLQAGLSVVVLRVDSRFQLQHCEPDCARAGVGRDRERGVPG